MAPYSLVRFMIDLYKSVHEFKRHPHDFGVEFSLFGKHFEQLSPKKGIHGNSSLFYYMNSMHYDAFIFFSIKKYLFHTVFHNIHAKQLATKLPKSQLKYTRFSRMKIHIHAQIICCTSSTSTRF